MESGEWMRISNAQLRYYMHIADPESLSDEEWAMRLREMEYIRQEEAKYNRAIFLAGRGK